jgi:hypothetical protein
MDFGADTVGQSRKQRQFAESAMRDWSASYLGQA